MANQDEVSHAGSKADGEIEDASKMMALAVKEMKHCLQVTDDSLSEICSEMEGVSSRPIIRPVFRLFNSITRIFLRLVPTAKYGALITQALRELGASPLFLTFLITAGSVEVAILSYKSSVLRDLAALIVCNQESHRVDDEKNDTLFSKFYLSRHGSGGYQEELGL